MAKSILFRGSSGNFFFSSFTLHLKQEEKKKKGHYSGIHVPVESEFFFFGLSIALSFRRSVIKLNAFNDTNFFVSLLFQSFTKTMLFYIRFLYYSKHYFYLSFFFSSLKAVSLPQLKKKKKKNSKYYLTERLIFIFKSALSFIYFFFLHKLRVTLRSQYGETV